MTIIEYKPNGKIEVISYKPYPEESHNDGTKTTDRKGRKEPPRSANLTAESY